MRNTPHHIYNYSILGPSSTTSVRNRRASVFRNCIDASNGSAFSDASRAACPLSPFNMDWAASADDGRPFLRTDSLSWRARAIFLTRKILSRCARRYSWRDWTSAESIYICASFRRIDQFTHRLWESCLFLVEKQVEPLELVSRLLDVRFGIGSGRLLFPTQHRLDGRK